MLLLPPLIQAAAGRQYSTSYSFRCSILALHALFLALCMHIVLYSVECGTLMVCWMGHALRQSKLSYFQCSLDNLCAPAKTPCATQALTAWQQPATYLSANSCASKHAILFLPLICPCPARTGSEPSPATPARICCWTSSCRATGLLGAARPVQPAIVLS